jgi:hypothetical protein
MNVLFPITIIVLSFLAAGVYAGCHDWARAVYWTAAAVISIATMFMGSNQ